MGKDSQLHSDHRRFYPSNILDLCLNFFRSFLKHSFDARTSFFRSFPKSRSRMFVPQVRLIPINKTRKTRPKKITKASSPSYIQYVRSRPNVLWLQSFFVVIRRTPCRIFWTNSLMLPLTYSKNANRSIQSRPYAGTILEPIELGF